MIERRQLDCGINVVMEKIPHVRSVSMGIWVKAGATDETAKNSGISHFIEHMMFKGTEKRSAKKIAEDVDEIGAQINAFTGKEATCYYIKTLEENIDRSLDVLTDMFLCSCFDKGEMKKEKSVIYEEIKMIRDTPDDDVHDMICEQIFKDHPLGRSVIGTPSSVRGISRHMIKEYIENEYTRDSIVISVSGSFDSDMICEKIQGIMEPLKKSKKKKTYPRHRYIPYFRVKQKDIQQAHICLGTRSISLTDERYYAFSCLNNIFGGSMSSRLFQKIREEKGLAYSVYSMNSSFSGDGYFNIYAGVATDKIYDTICAIKQEIETISKKGVLEEELKKAKEQLKSTYIFGQENVNGRMISMGRNLTLIGRVYEPKEVLDSIDAVTADDIKKVSKIISDPKRYSAAAITNKRVSLKKMVQA